MSAYYNEIDPEKAEWIRELIKAGVVAPGDVDERSICDVRPDDLRGYTQRHFFAGIAVWSYALRLAGWPDDRPVWTGSCPCPSFSCAGKGAGFSDPRHLWPHWFRLIRECRPDVLLGEQVEAAIGHGWLDLVQDQLESAHYAVGAAVLTAAGVGAPHIRSRLYFCADRFGSDSERDGGRSDLALGQAQGRTADGRDCATGELCHAYCERFNGQRVCLQPREPRFDNAETAGASGSRPWRGPGWLDPLTARSVAQAGATRGFWRDCDWWYGRDGKYRPIGPGLFPLAHGAAARVLRLRGYGDGICAPLAQEFIEAYIEARQLGFQRRPVIDNDAMWEGYAKEWERP